MILQILQMQWCAENALQLALLPKDAADTKPAMLEIRPGTGGDEAALFAGDLLRMYQRYSEARGWKFEILEEQSTELGGIKEVVAHIKGDNVFARMKFESVCTGFNGSQAPKAVGVSIPRQPLSQCCPRLRM